jgi:hypothetical protein
MSETCNAFNILEDHLLQKIINYELESSVFSSQLQRNVHILTTVWSHYMRYYISSALNLLGSFASSFPVTGGRLCGLVVRVLGYRSGGPGSIPGTTEKKSSGSGTGFTQPLEYN